MTTLVSPDSKRAVTTGATVLPVLTAGRPHTVITETAEGRTRVWRASSREWARTIVRVYRAHGGTAVYSPPVKVTR
jgi:hypothetical protein